MHFRTLLSSCLLLAALPVLAQEAPAMADGKVTQDALIDALTPAPPPLRLMDMGVPRYMVGGSLQAVLAQRLVRVICESCSGPACWPTVPACPTSKATSRSLNWATRRTWQPDWLARPPSSRPVRRTATTQSRSAG